MRNLIERGIFTIPDVLSAAECAPVVEGLKYVLRSDVMYGPPRTEDVR